MDYLREKSRFNLDSAKELIEMGYYAPSIHCSYYASFQYMKYSLKKFGDISYEYIEKECKTYHGGTHGYIIDVTLGALKEKIIDKHDFVTIKRMIKDLKSYRVRSDYFNIQISPQEADISFRNSETIIRSIKQNLKI